MRFLVDAQLPPRLTRLFISLGYDSTHTEDLPTGNRTSDPEIRALADREGWVVVTKDRGFRDDHLLRRSPAKLLVIVVGNTTNAELLSLVERQLPTIEAVLGEADMVELGSTLLVVYGAP
ncbi:MAG: DUF5615 family PIN-like protein [Acidimicrobiales bacterium]